VALPAGEFGSPRPGDRRLLAPEVATALQYLVCSAPGPPVGSSDRWLLRDGGSTRERALAVARELIGRGWAFVLKPAVVLDAPWPEDEPEPARRYTIDDGRFGVLVPSPRSTARPSRGGESASLLVAVCAVEADETVALARAKGLGVRALVGRVAAVVSLDMGYEGGPIRKMG
jgi:hypothetical protein